MSQAIVNGLKGPIDNSFALLAKFIEVCPENIWAEKSGGWPVWQQVYHVVGAVDFFISVPGLPPSEPLAKPAFGELSEVADITVAKNQIKTAVDEAQARIDKYVATLTDEDLAKRNEHLFAAANMDMTVAATLSLLAAHTLYHLGSCDAALRDNGLKGVF